MNKIFKNENTWHAIECHKCYIQYNHLRVLKCQIVWLCPIVLNYKSLCLVRSSNFIFSHSNEKQILLSLNVVCAKLWMGRIFDQICTSPFHNSISFCKQKFFIYFFFAKLARCLFLNLTFRYASLKLCSNDIAIKMKSNWAWMLKPVHQRMMK